MKRKRYMVYVVVNGKPLMFSLTRYFNKESRAEKYRNKLSKQLQPYNLGKDSLELLKDESYYFEVWIKDLEVFYGSKNYQNNRS